jgi:hypothetical protein
MDNTGAPLLGLVFAPVTWLFSPVAALSLIMRLAFALSAISMFFVLRRWTKWGLAAFTGGLVYAFSPYMVGQAQAHDFLTFVPLPPLIMALVDELVIRRHHLVRNGALLGVCLAAQLLISPEVLGMCAVAALCALMVLAVRHPHAARERARAAVVGIGTAGGAFVALAAYPLWVYVLGPYHVSGPQHQVSSLQQYHSAVESLVYPTSLERFGTSGMFATGNALDQANAVEHASYLGIPLTCALVLIAVRFRREGLVQLFALVALGAWLVTLGPVLYIGTSGHPSLPLPYDLIKHLPLIDAGLDLRYSLIMFLAVAIVLSVGLDRLHEHGAFASAMGWPRQLAGRRARAGICVAMAVIVLVPLVPRLPYTSTPLGVPAVFTAKASPVADGDVVLAYPLPVGYEGSNDQALLWQAEAGMRFKLIGFRGALAGKDHQRLVGADVLLPPPEAEDILLWAIYGLPSPPPPFGVATARAIKTFLVRYHVGDIVIVPWGSGTASALPYFTAALQVAPENFGGAYVWSHVQRLLGQPTGTPAHRSGPGGDIGTKGGSKGHADPANTS